MIWKIQAWPEEEQRTDKFDTIEWSRKTAAV